MNMATMNDILNTVMRARPDADRNEISEQLNEQVDEVISRGKSISDIAEAYYSNSKVYYWYVMPNTGDFQRFILEDVNKLQIKPEQDKKDSLEELLGAGLDGDGRRRKGRVRGRSRSARASNGYGGGTSQRGGRSRLGKIAKLVLLRKR